MTSRQTANAVVDQCFLEIRARLLELAAALDRIERAKGAEEVDTDPRLSKIRDCLAILESSGIDRAERIQMVFSDPYEPDWNC